MVWKCQVLNGIGKVEHLMAVLNEYTDSELLMSRD